jgi:hypothetical protein
MYWGWCMGGWVRSFVDRLLRSELGEGGLVHVGVGGLYISGSVELCVPASAKARVVAFPD